MDCYFAQIEAKRLNLSPDVPLAVRQYHGLLASNYAARAFGITRSTTAQEAKRLCPGIALPHAPLWRSNTSPFQSSDANAAGRCRADCTDCDTAFFPSDPVTEPGPPGSPYATLVAGVGPSRDTQRRHAADVAAGRAQPYTPADAPLLERLAEEEISANRYQCRVHLEHYRAEGRRLINLLNRFGDVVEKCSIDEACLDVTHRILVEAIDQLGRAPFIAAMQSSTPYSGARLPVDWTLVGECIGLPQAVPGAAPDAGPSLVALEDVLLHRAALLGQEIRAAVRSELGLTASTGVAHNKLLAKLATSWRKPDGQSVVRASPGSGGAQPADGHLAELGEVDPETPGPDVPGQSAVQYVLRRSELKSIRALGGKLGMALQALFGVRVASDAWALSRADLRAALVASDDRMHGGGESDDEGPGGHEVDRKGNASTGGGPGMGEAAIQDRVSWLWALLRGRCTEVVRSKRLLSSLTASRHLRPPILNAIVQDRWQRLLSSDLSRRICVELREHTRWPRAFSVAFALEGVGPLFRRSVPFPHAPMSMLRLLLGAKHSSDAEKAAGEEKLPEEHLSLTSVQLNRELFLIIEPIVRRLTQELFHKFKKLFPCTFMALGVTNFAPLTALSESPAVLLCAVPVDELPEDSSFFLDVNAAPATPRSMAAMAADSPPSSHPAAVAPAPGQTTLQQFYTRPGAEGTSSALDLYSVPGPGTPPSSLPPVAPGASTPRQAGSRRPGVSLAETPGSRSPARRSLVASPGRRGALRLGGSGSGSGSRASPSASPASSMASLFAALPGPAKPAPVDLTPAPLSTRFASYEDVHRPRPHLVDLTHVFKPRGSILSYFKAADDQQGAARLAADQAPALDATPGGGPPPASPNKRARLADIPPPVSPPPPSAPGTPPPRNPGEFPPAAASPSPRPAQSLWQVCPDCQRNIPVTQMPEHADWHLAMRLSLSPQ
ncbi:hypothetical protein H696_03305 [Fonticula alba]|uniref:UmuC domain-containing protein n=1 Tax=Fonticula alba TaxID=691883 RepID=A0A058Z8H4_FONAL|nr:hypothetical protein H696_03305 [Fonticula alba]KCV69832.1 hypothetical protein H696_03305 [Fonticula alba]|eukprot:XP_009495438.1 hypothetical protein H696_03305 [Fonticula alba]